MIPEKMKAVVITEAKKAVVMELTTPRPQRGEVLVRVERALICTWEQRIFGGGDMALPFVPGHEISGTVVEIGEDTFANVQVGDMVVVKTFDSCGQCENCYRGADNQCTGKARKRSYDGIPGTGGFAQYLAIGSDRVFPLPGTAVDLDAAAFAEPISCCLHSLDQAQLEMGEDVVIVGGGIMGQLHNLLAKSRGARTLLVEPDAQRRAMAAKMGADVVIDPTAGDPIAAILEQTGGRGAHACFFTVNVLSLAQQYIGALAKRGRMVYYGSFHPSGAVDMDPNHLHYSEKLLTGSFSPTAKGFWTASRLLGYGLVDVKPFISERYALADCQQALERAASPETYRVLLDLSE